MPTLLPPDILHATAEDKLACVDALLQSLADPGVSSRYLKELQRRATEMERNPNLGRPWSQVKKSRRAT